METHSGLFQNANMFNIAATAAGVWMFISNWWIIILLGFVWLMSRNKGDKADKKVKHLPTKDEVVKMVYDLYT